MPHQQEWNPVTFANDKVGPRRKVLPIRLNVGPERKCVRAGNCLQVAVDGANPRNDRSIVEPNDELHLHRDLATNAFDNTNHVWFSAARRHEVDHTDDAASRFEICLEDQRVSAIAAFRRHCRRARGNAPAAVTLVAEQGSEACARIESWKTEPINRAVPSDKGGRVGVANEAVILYP